jgi:hypothetical protein
MGQNPSAPFDPKHRSRIGIAKIVNAHVERRRESGDAIPRLLRRDVAADLPMIAANSPS